tara:strand:+ start:208 stop:456 length:249 start_codon:yes stop_codon:yes gene_type:complete
MSFTLDNIIKSLKINFGVTIFFVRVVRYDNIKREFSEYKLPTWLRDLVGILKISFAEMLQFSNIETVKIGAIGRTILLYHSI